MHHLFILSRATLCSSRLHVIILALDALDIYPVRRYDCKSLQQLRYGQVDVSEFKTLRTVALWASFLTGDKIDEESEELKDQEDKLDEEKEKTDEDKKDLDERAKETDKLLEEALDSPPPDEPDNKPDPELSDYLRNRGG